MCSKSCLQSRGDGGWGMGMSAPGVPSRRCESGRAASRGEWVSQDALTLALGESPFYPCLMPDGSRASTYLPHRRIADPALFLLVTCCGIRVVCLCTARESSPSSKHPITPPLADPSALSPQPSPPARFNSFQLVSRSRNRSHLQHKHQAWCHLIRSELVIRPPHRPSHGCLGHAIVQSRATHPSWLRT